jgi:hypothetical protein
MYMYDSRFTKQKNKYISLQASGTFPNHRPVNFIKMLN